MDVSIQATDPQHASAVVMVADSCDYAARALNAQGIEPTAEAVAMLACKIADTNLALRRLELDRERIELERERVDRG